MTGDVGDPMVAEFDTVAGQSDRIGRLLGSGQLTSQVILLARE
jgi:hypothetical protein